MPSSDEDEDFEEKPAARKSGFAPIGGKVSLFGDRKDSEEDTRISKWDKKSLSRVEKMMKIEKCLQLKEMN